MGLEDGWQDFYDYWTSECEKDSDFSDFCFFVSENDEKIAVIYVSTNKNEATVSEFILSLSMRKKDYGTAILDELILQYS